MTERTASSALMPLSEALGILLRGVEPVAPTTLPLADAVGRVAAEDVPAAADSPARRTALRDGWAVRADDAVGASAYAPVALAAPPSWVEAGETLPDGTDTVLPPEAIEASGPIAEIVAGAPAGAGTRLAAGDLAAGSLILAAGQRIRPVHALAKAASDPVRVRLPRVAIVLARSGAEARAATLRSLVERAGAAVSGIVAPARGPEALAAALVAETADLCLVVGGTGFGREDHAAASLARAGRLAAHGLALRPGESAGFGRAEGRPVLLLPGAPEAMLAAFLVLARPLLRALAGAAPEAARAAPLLRKVSSAIGLSEIVFVAEGAGGVDPLGSAELALHRLLLARGAILVPPEREGYPEGTSVEIMPL